MASLNFVVENVFTVAIETIIKHDTQNGSGRYNKEISIKDIVVYKHQRYNN